MSKSITERVWYTIYLTPLVSVSLLVYIWNATNPGTIGPFGILCVFVLLYLFFASIFFIFLHLGFYVFKRSGLMNFFLKRRDEKPFNWRVSYYIASVFAFMPVLLLAMQSVNQLSLRDVVLVVMFVALAIFYIIKRI